MELNYKSKINTLLGQYNHYKEVVREEKIHLVQSKQTVIDTESAQKIIQGISESIQKQVYKQIASVVSNCLESIFEDPYEFQIIFEQKRGKTEARLVFIREGHEIEPLSGAGGGCVDIAGLALRLACLVLSRPQRRRVLILDEPFKGISADYRPLVPKLLQTLAEKMQCQFIFVTNIKDYICGKVIDLDEEM